MYGIPESTIADYIKLTSEFFIAKKKHDSQDRMCKEIGIGQSKKDPRTNYYISPYHDIGEKGFVKKENIGLRLTIDEVNIGDQVYTILANSEKNKIVALIPGVKSSIVTEVIRKEISYEELQKEGQCKIDRKKYIPKKLENSETRLDFITRLRYQLFERRKDWGINQLKRWEVLKIHSEFDEIQISYELLEKFYEIYDSKISGEQARFLWNEWFQRISKYESIKELQNAGRTVKNHIEGILNYFDGRSTNAFAEGLHSRIRRLISNVRGFKNKHYMLHRIMKIFA